MPNTSKSPSGSKAVAKTLAKIGDEFNKKYNGPNRNGGLCNYGGSGGRNNFSRSISSGGNSSGLGNTGSNNNSLGGINSYNKLKQSTPKKK